MLKDHYCTEREVGKKGRIVPPMLSAKDLDEQSGSYFRACLNVAPGLIMRRNTVLAAMAASASSSKDTSKSDKASSAASTKSPTSKMWKSFTANQQCSDVFPEFAKLAEIVLCMVPGSVENERTFSSLAFIKNDQRNRLETEHLNVCLRLFSAKSTYTLETFPYERAFEAWSAECERRGASLAS